MFKWALQQLSVRRTRTERLWMSGVDTPLQSEVTHGACYTYHENQCIVVD